MEHSTNSFFSSRTRELQWLKNLDAMLRMESRGFRKSRSVISVSSSGWCHFPSSIFKNLKLNFHFYFLLIFSKHTYVFQDSIQHFGCEMLSCLKKKQYGLDRLIKVEKPIHWLDLWTRMAGCLNNKHTTHVKHKPVKHLPNT